MKGLCSVNVQLAVVLTVDRHLLCYMTIAPGDLHKNPKEECV